MVEQGKCCESMTSDGYNHEPDCPRHRFDIRRKRATLEADIAAFGRVIKILKADGIIWSQIDLQKRMGKIQTELAALDAEKGGGE